MNLNEEFNKLIPFIADEIKHSYKEIGESYIVADEDGGGAFESEYEENGYLYNEDGWFIEVIYRCTGYGCKSAWGEVIEISATHDDEENDEIAMSDEQINKLCGAVNSVLAHFRP